MTPMPNAPPGRRSSPSESLKTSTARPSSSPPTKANRSQMSFAKPWSGTSKPAAGSALTVGTRNQPHGTTQLAKSATEQDMFGAPAIHATRILAILDGGN